MGFVAGAVAQIAAPIVAPLIEKAAGALIENVTKNLPIFGDLFQKVADTGLKTFSAAQDFAGDTARVASRAMMPPTSYADGPTVRDHRSDAVVRDHRDPWAVDQRTAELFRPGSYVLDRFPTVRPRFDRVIDVIGGRDSGGFAERALDSAFDQRNSLENQLNNLDPNSDSFQKDLAKIQQKMAAVNQMIELISNMRKAFDDTKDATIRNIA